MRRSSFRCLLVLCASCAIPAFAVAQAAAGATGATAMAPLQVRDVLGVREFPDRVQVELTPDGKFVAFALRNPARGAGKDGSAYFSATGVPRGMRGTDIY